VNITVSKTLQILECTRKHPSQRRGARSAKNAAGTTRFSFKVEQNKIPEFFGEKGKDTISAMDYITRVDDLTANNGWSNTAAYNNFANSLRVGASE